MAKLGKANNVCTSNRSKEALRVWKPLNGGRSMRFIATPPTPNPPLATTRFRRDAVSVISTGQWTAISSQHRVSTNERMHPRVES